MAAVAIPKFDRLFREAAGLDVDKDDLKRLQDWVTDKLRDLIAVGRAAARENNRDVLVYHDLPITAGLQKCIDDFEKMDTELQLQPVLDRLARHPPDVVFEVEAERRLPAVVGGLTVALARSLKVIDPKVRNPSSEHWERSTRLFDLLL